MDKINELLVRGIDIIYPSKEELERVLRSGKKLRIYQGFDPTSPQLHIGHMLGLRKLKQWQDLGHEVIFLIGDFTGMIGDPTGKDKTRIPLTREQVLENAKTYKEQASKVLRFKGDNPVIIQYNSEWLGKLSAEELLKLTSYLSIQQVIERDMFQERIKKGSDISLNEFLYPFLQGYDSVAMDVDLEIGGSDQLFNMMTGRDLMHKIKSKEKFVMTTPLLTDASGRKIGKTEGNAIGLTDKPEDLFGKLMTLPDDVIIKGFEYLTNLSMEEIGEIKKAIEDGANPMKYKKKLAFEITKDLNSEKQAQKAQENFEKTVQQKELPEEIPTVTLSINVSEGVTVEDILSQLNLVDSKSEAKRVIQQRGVTIDNELIDNPQAPFMPKDGTIIKVGKRKFVKVRIPA